MGAPRERETARRDVTRTHHVALLGPLSQGVRFVDQGEHLGVLRRLPVLIERTVNLIRDLFQHVIERCPRRLRRFRCHRRSVPLGARLGRLLDARARFLCVVVHLAMHRSGSGTR